MSGEVPPLATAPSDFSRILVRPPALFPGLGLSSNDEPSKRLMYRLYSRMQFNSFSAICRVRARFTSRGSAPKISVVSAGTGVPPHSLSRSEQYPRAGLAVMPENESDPPQLSP